MKKIIIILLAILTVPAFTFSQIIYSPRIDSVINLVSLPLMTKYVRDLSGDTITNIGGQPYRIISRLWNSQGNSKAAEYIYGKFQSFGLQTRYQIHNPNTMNYPLITNVIAKKTGWKYPNQKIVIGAHYDNMRGGALLTDTIPGADDNASGVAAVIEAARLLASYNLKFTVEFVVFDEEEIGLIGSRAYADSCRAASDTIIGVLNMDMIAWDGNNDGVVRIMTHQFCDILADMLINTYQRYNINLSAVKSFNSGGSDHVAFWERGYFAITSIEPVGDFNPYYHSLGDLIGFFNSNYFLKNSKANLAALMSIGDELFYLISHNPVQSSFDTTQRITYSDIFFGVPFASGAGAPRLYYKTGNGPFHWVNASHINGSGFEFTIPGQPTGTQISYYIAAQDSTGIYLATSPPGGSGVNPPGTTPPPQLYVYHVLSHIAFTSNNQKPISDNQYTRDTIHIPENGIVQDLKLNLNLNHTNDGDILITLLKGSSIANLSQFNGNNGQNYTNTTFHDTASFSITQGTPPFTGYFRPQATFSTFNGTQMQGDWILRIYDMRTGNTGTLLNWSLDIKYSKPVSVKKEETITADKFMLYQNYPNPFNPSTVIRYSISENSNVLLKIYDVLGKEVTTLINEGQSAGTYSVSWNAVSMPAGVYFYRLNANEYTETKRMILMK